MTKDEFFKKLRKSRWYFKWSVDDVGHIRATPRFLMWIRWFGTRMYQPSVPRWYCPITAVWTMENPLHAVESSNFIAVANAMGLSTQDSLDIVLAADNRSEHNSEVRSDLLNILGLRGRTHGAG